MEAMDSRIRLIVASLVAASVAYLFAVIAFTGTLDLVAAAVFLGLFVVLPVLGHATWHLYRRVLPG